MGQTVCNAVMPKKREEEEDNEDKEGKDEGEDEDEENECLQFEGMSAIRGFSVYRDLILTQQPSLRWSSFQLQSCSLWFSVLIQQPGNKK